MKIKILLIIGAIVFVGMILLPSSISQSSLEIKDNTNAKESAQTTSTTYQWSRAFIINAYSYWNWEDEGYFEESPDGGLITHYNISLKAKVNDHWKIVGIPANENTKFFLNEVYDRVPFEMSMDKFVGILINDERSEYQYTAYNFIGIAYNLKITFLE